MSDISDSNSYLAPNTGGPQPLHALHRTRATCATKKNNSANAILTGSHFDFRVD